MFDFSGSCRFDYRRSQMRELDTGEQNGLSWKVFLRTNIMTNLQMLPLSQQMLQAIGADQSNKPLVVNV